MVRFDIGSDRLGPWRRQRRTISTKGSNMVSKLQPEARGPTGPVWELTSLCWLAVVVCGLYVLSARLTFRFLRPMGLLYFGRRLE